MKTELRPREWVVRYGDYLFSVASFKIDDTELAKDLVQETFLSAIKGKENFRGECSEKTWLVRILNNKITDHYRAGKKTTPLSEYLGETHRSFNDYYFDLDTPGEYGHNKASAFPPIAELESDYAINQQELKRVLDQCIRKLPTTLSNVFLMKYLSGESAGFICSKFNISQANYWVILHRSKLLLRTCISRIWPS